MADWRRIMNVNLVGSALIEQASAPLMARAVAPFYRLDGGGHRAT
jgi:hypothetical protein